MGPARIKEKSGLCTRESSRADRSGLFPSVDPTLRRAPHKVTTRVLRTHTDERAQPSLSISAVRKASSRLCWWFSRGSQTLS